MDTMAEAAEAASSPRDRMEMTMEDYFMTLLPLAQHQEYFLMEQYLKTSPAIPVQEIANAVTIVAANGSLRSMKVLLTYGADIDGYDDLGKTPLTQALDHMQEVMVLYLLAQGANPNKPDLLGNRPLHWSIHSEGEQSRFLEDEFGIVRPAHSRLTTLLIEFGATVTLCNRTGEFPIDVACAYGHREAVTLLHRIHTTHTA